MAVFLAIMIIPLIGVVGLAVDGVRLFMVETRLTTAVDAAVLVAARDMNDPLRNTNATNLFWGNFQQSAPGSSVGFLNTTVSAVTVATVNTSTVSMKAMGVMPTTFMNVLGIPSLNVAAASQASAAVTGVELSLVLDNTGSMVGWPIQSLVTSATNLVDIVYGSTGVDTLPNLWISVVPFTAEVNIGSSNTGLLQNGKYHANTYMNGSWSGCVMARFDSTDSATGLTNDFTDVPPGSAPFTPFLYPSTYGQYKVTGAGPPVPITGDNDWTPTNITETNQVTLQNNAIGPNLGCSQTGTGSPLPILPFSASKSAVEGVIAQMTANFRGGTFINLGLQAGWWTLSPRWRGATGWGNATLPLNYNTVGMKKVIVLITDGNNQWFDWSGGAPGAGPYPWVNDGDTDFSGYGRLLQNNMNLPAGQNTQANATANINARMGQMCTLIKQQGIIIYTILFNHDGTVTTDTQSLFQACASSPANYFLDVTDAQLQATFSDIGGQIATLRLTQ